MRRAGVVGGCWSALHRCTQAGRGLFAWTSLCLLLHVPPHVLCHHIPGQPLTRTALPAPYCSRTAPQDDPAWYIADPVCTLLFAVLVLWTTKAIMRDISDVLMERVPRGLCIKTINDDLSRVS